MLQSVSSVAVASLALLTAAIAGLSVMSGQHWSEHLYLDWSSWTAFHFFMYTFPLGFTLAVLALSHTLSSRALPRSNKITILWTSIAVLVVIQVVLWSVMIRPYLPPRHGIHPEDQDSFSIFSGVFLSFLGLWLLAALVLVLQRTLKQTAAQASDVDDASMHSALLSTDTSATVPPLRSFADRLGDDVFFLVSAVFLILAIAVAAAFYPPIWNVPVDYYWPLESPHTWLSITVEPNELVMKIYPDHVVFYAFMLFMIGVGMIVRTTNAFNRALHRPLRPWSFLPGEYRKTTVTVGEVLVSLAGLSLAVYWFHYWCFYYVDARTGRIAKLPFWERSARTWGHMLNLLLAFVIMPVTRNSIWLKLFGIPFERAIRAHRWLGTMVVLVLSLHALSWWLFWLELDQLSDVFNVTPIIIDTRLLLPHRDNFLMPTLTITWLSVLAMAALSFNLVRRQRFQLFMNAHYLVVPMFYFVALSHAWNLWPIVAFSLAMYFVDRAVRFVNGTSQVRVVRFAPSVDGGHTEIDLLVDNFSFSAGQYAFLCVPSISPTEYHPFSICSSPATPGGLVSFKIKDAGDWTHELHELALEGGSDRTVDIKVDGGYGRPMEPMDFDHVLLCAGGVGVTPMFSLLEDLYRHKQQGEDLPAVTFAWSVRDVRTVAMLENELHEINQREDIHVIIYVTKAKSEGTTTRKNLPYTPGRPKINEIINDMDMRAPRLGVYACGPAPMVQAIADLCYERGTAFHEETFAL